MPETSRLFKLSNKINKLNTFAIDFPGKPKEIIDAIKNIKKLKKVIIKNNINIVHTNGTPDHKIIMLCKWFYRLDFKIVRTKHDSFAIKTNWFANKLYGKYTDSCIVVSNYQYNNILTEKLQKKTTIIHNGIDLEYFKPRYKNHELMQELKISSDDFVFVSVAGTALHKGWQYLVKKVSCLDDNVKYRIKIVLAGGVPNEAVLKKYINDIGMKNSVILTVLIEDVRKVISIGDCGFVLSSVETISFACREMMAMGLPVIVSDYAGLPENIENNKDGWIVNVNNQDQFHNILAKIVNNIKKFSQNAVTKFQNKFGVNDFIKKTTKVYYKV